MNLIDFMQNDDWVYYKMVSNFLRGDFRLDPISAPTFYTQGLLGFLFSKIFSVQALPYLTIGISILACFLLWKILNSYFQLSKLKSLFITLFLGFNPLFVYSMWGFMTENYFIACLLVNYLLFYKFEKSQKNTDLFLLGISIFVSFMLRQVALVFPLSMAIFYLLNKKFRLSFISGLFFLVLFLFYTLVFPQTAEMQEKPLYFLHLFEKDYVIALIYGSLIYLTALLLPLVMSNIKVIPTKISLRIVLFVITSVAIHLLLNANFKPHPIFWGEFPYFKNTWERMGFYTRGLSGTKYQFVGNYDLYKYWDLMAKTTIALFISYLLIIFEKKKLLDFNLIFAGIYTGLLLLTEVFYDRYLLVIFIPIILFLTKNILLNNKKIIFGSGFLIFIMFYCYQFSMDFTLVNKYVWNKSQEIVYKENIDPKEIEGTNAWKLVNRNESKNYTYKFSYDSQHVNENFRKYYDLIEKKKIEYPLNFFINSTVYLYKIKD